MGSSTKFYTKAEVTIEQVSSIIEKHFDTNVTVIDDIPLNFLRFTIYLNGREEQRTLWISFDSHWNDEKVTSFDLGAWGYSIDIMKVIASYFGGWFRDNDCNGEEAYFIEATESPIELSNEQKLYAAITKVAAYNQTQILLSFIQENEELIKSLNFGRN